MISQPLITLALLGTNRGGSAVPPPPDDALSEIWQAVDWQNPAAAVLHALALTRALQHAGNRTREAPPAAGPAPETSAITVPPAAVDAARRLLSGESPEFLPEWLDQVIACGKTLPARILPEFLTTATKSPALRPAAATLAGERGLWLARRHPEFSWLLESTTPPDTAWDEGTPAERIAWLRHTRTTDPARASTTIASHWKDEDGAMRQAILRLIVPAPHPVDEPWLAAHALGDRRQEIREAAAAALASLPHSAFRQRSLDRARAHLRIERRLLRRTLVVNPPNAFDPAWTTDAIREKPPQGTGEKAWWLRQIIARIPLDDWPILLETDPATLFTLPVDPDWRDTLLLGWIDSATRLPHRALPDHFLPFLAAIDPWPFPTTAKIHLLATLIEPLDPAIRFPTIERVAQALPIIHAIDLLARIATPPPTGQGKKITAIIDQAIHGEMAALTRPQARALAACLPPDAIQGRLELIAKLKEIPTAVESFATALEFRRAMLSHLTKP